MIKSLSTYAFLLLFGILLSNNKIEAQNRIDSILSIKKIIQQENTVSSPGVGLFFSPSRYWYAFAYLAHLATNEELAEITNENNTALRIYAYFGLLYKNYSDLKNIKKRLFKDKATVNTFFGCISGRDMEVASCIKYYTKRYYDESWTKKLLIFLKENEEYRNQLYDELVNNKKISRPLLVD